MILIFTDLLTLSQLEERILSLLETFLNNSQIPQNSEMKFFKFNFTPLGIIFVYGNNSGGPQVLSWRPFVMNLSQNRKVKKLAKAYVRTRTQISLSSHLSTSYNKERENKK